MWRTDLLIDAAEAALCRREAQLALEHAVYGLDSLIETELHPIIAAGLRAAGAGVLLEQPYPREWRSKRERRKSTLPNTTDRLRCDLVLTPEPGQRLMDSLETERAVVADRLAIEGTLFAELAASASGLAEGASSATRLATGHKQTPAESSDTAIAAAEDAYWLEVKLISQFSYTHGVPSHNHAYASELRRATRDLAKLGDDPGILRAGLLMVMFAATEEIARHDLFRVVHECLDRDVPVASPEIRSLPIRERIGNTTLTLALLDLRKPAAS